MNENECMQADILQADGRFNVFSKGKVNKYSEWVTLYRGLEDWSVYHNLKIYKSKQGDSKI